MIDALADRLCNWGRWGPDDQRGTVNFITPAKVASAARLVRDGDIYGLSIELGAGGPQLAHPRRFNPLHFMTAIHQAEQPGGASSADDVLVLPLQAGTQWDALAHIAHRGQMYGGRPATQVGISGAETNSIGAVSDQIMTRGVLADVARWRRTAELPPGYTIGPDELAGCLAHQDADVQAGDILLVRTGFLGGRRRDGWRGFSADAPGLGVRALEWIHASMLAGVAVDTSAAEVRPFSVPGVAMPFHIVGLVYMGLLLGEIFDLDALAERCASDGRYEFLLVAPPMNVTGGVGSPVNPYAIR